MHRLSRFLTLIKNTNTNTTRMPVMFKQSTSLAMKAMHFCSQQSPPPPLNTQISEKLYVQQCNKCLDEITDLFDDSEQPQIEDFEFSEGVVKIVCRGKKTFVINRQVPNKQIWLSSPISGPQRFNYDTEQSKWLNSRGQEIIALLQQEVAKL